MNDSSSQKIEPVITPRPDAEMQTRPVADERVAGAVSPATRHFQTSFRNNENPDQLARIEEKTARIEEKFARSETLFLRLQSTFEDAMSEFGGLARRSDVTAIETRVRRIPGFGALVVVAVLAAVLSAAATVAALKFGIPFVVLPR